MKAVLLAGYGGVDQLNYEDVPDPVPGPGEVLVRVISTSVNPIDFKIRAGMMKETMPLKLPFILGYDVAGEVKALGDGVEKFHAGDKVMGVVSYSYAEFLTAKADILTAIPEGLDPAEAGVLPLILLTGAQLIEAGVRPVSQEIVLVTGAAGNVGRTAVFAAKECGAIVIAGVRLRQKAEAHSLGADSVAAIDDESDIHDLPELDAIADTVGGRALSPLLSKLKRSGRLASVVGKPDAPGVDVRPVWSHPDPDRLHALATAVKDGRLKIPIALRLPLREIREAHQAAEKGGGKIALLP